VGEQPPTVDNAEDANAARLDAAHDPILVDESLAAVGILESGIIRKA